jgi:phosphoglycolate phosphatase-like HAD superfamily hydrolase
MPHENESPQRAALAVALDCDGVILESVAAKTRAFGRLFAAHGPEAAAYMTAWHLAHGGVSRYRKFAHFYRERLGREISPEETAELDRRLSDLCLDEVLASPMVPGAQAFLEVWSGRLPLYVVSGTPEGELRGIFERRGLARHFRAVYGSPAAKPEILARILADEGLPPRRLLMVGDSSTDRDAAMGLGALFYGRGEFPGLPCAPDLTGLAAFVAGLLAAVTERDA